MNNLNDLVLKFKGKNNISEKDSYDMIQSL